MSEGVRDDFKAMTQIYSRLCTYLDLAATNPPPPLRRGSGEQASGPTSTRQSSASSGGLPDAGTVSISTGAATDFVPPAPPAADAASAPGTGVPHEAAPGTASPAIGGGALSTFIAAAPSFSTPSTGLPEAAPAAAGAVAGAASAGVLGGGGGTEELAALEEGLLNDLDVSGRVLSTESLFAGLFARLFGRSPQRLWSLAPGEVLVRLDSESVIPTWCAEASRAGATPGGT